MTPSLYPKLAAQRVLAWAAQPSDDPTRRGAAVVDRQDIERTLENLNAAENSRAESGVDEVVAAIDRTMSLSVEGWMNGEHRPDREAERTIERSLFADFPDYRRSIERAIIDPPFAAIAWKICGTSRSLGRKVEIAGSSHLEFDGDGRIARYWIFVDPSRLSSPEKVSAAQHLSGPRLSTGKDVP